MLHHIPLLSIVAALPAGFTGINVFLSEVFNSLAGRSKLFDSLVALPINNDFVKAAVIGSCFLAVWYGKETLAETQKARRILLVTLAAAVCVIATTKALSHTVFLPRPYIQSQKIYHLEGDRLVENKRVDYRVPLDRASQDAYRDLLDGQVDPSDLGSFPSDHAGFYVTLALGIFLASRTVGWIALGWTFLAILGGRVITGMHSPLDIIAGAAIAGAELAVCQYVARRWFGRLVDWVSQLTLRYSAVSSAVLFAIVFEMSSTLTHLPPLLSAVGKYTLGIGK